MPCGIARFPLLSLRDIFPRRGGSLSSQGELLVRNFSDGRKCRFPLRPLR